MKKVKILDKEFKITIPAASVKQVIDNMALQITNDYADEEVFFVGILNGAFMFSADLIKKIRLPCQVSFVKLSSYDGSSSSGEVRELIGLIDDIKGRHVIVLEDIVETGLTLETIIKLLKPMKPASLKIATLLFKPQAYQQNLKLDYIGLEIPNQFIIGYGLDYHGYGRNYEDIYSAIK
jgi:hypoxanthine phosphoribosyltransferase